MKNIVANKITNEVLGIKKDEVVIITYDNYSSQEVMDAFMEKIYDVGAKPMLLRFAVFSSPYDEVNDIPQKAFLELLKNTDCWLDIAKFNFSRSDILNKAIKVNDHLRYMCIRNKDIDILYKIYGKLDVESMTELTDKLREMLLKATNVRIANEKGTDVTYEMDKNHLVVADNGNAKTPGIHTDTSTLNVVPKFGSVNGVIVMDSIYAHPYPYGILKQPMKIVVEKGIIVDFEGDKEEIKEVIDWIEKYNDPNMYKLGDTGFGLTPYSSQLTGDMFQDERTWGIVYWGIGDVSPLDAPPKGQMAASHMDGICTSVSVWIDDVQIMENGHFIHDDLKELGAKLNK